MYLAYMQAIVRVKYTQSVKYRQADDYCYMEYGPDRSTCMLACTRFTWTVGPRPVTDINHSQCGPHDLVVHEYVLSRHACGYYSHATEGTIEVAGIATSGRACMRISALGAHALLFSRNRQILGSVDPIRSKARGRPAMELSVTNHESYIWIL
jgi:hypothetical protein